MAVVTYHPDKKKLLHTLSSILEQKWVKLQIVVADDGSEENYFDEVEAFFQEKGFANYRLVKNEVNGGTVKNCISAVQAAENPVIKLISPGDYFAYDMALYDWVKVLLEQEADWSFCDAYYYHLDKQGNVCLEEQLASPHYIKPYKIKNFTWCRWNYIAHTDFCLGASIVVKTDILKKYLPMIENRVIYAEDNICSLMMLDGLKVEYYNHFALMYEYGSGISTGQNMIWSKRIYDDYISLCNIMLEKIHISGLQGWLLRKAIHANMTENPWLRRIKRVFLPGTISNKFRKKRKTPTVWLEE